MGEYFRESSVAALKNACRGTSLFSGQSDAVLTRYCGGYQRFAAMAKGDMVAMLIPGPPGKGEACFGVLTSDKLILMSPDKCAAKGFPALHLLGGHSRFNGLMLREVRWLRTGYVRHLPGQKAGKNGVNTLPWLVETGPFWLLKTNTSALDKMKSRAFLANTK